MALSLATHPSRYPLPQLKTPDHVIHQLKAAVAADDMVAFRELLAAPQTDAKELSCIMKEALARDHAVAASELIRHGRNVGYSDGQAAIAARAKNCLTVFLDSGWDLNEARSHATPSVLRYVPGCYLLDSFRFFWNPPGTFSNPTSPIYSRLYLTILAKWKPGNGFCHRLIIEVPRGFAGQKDALLLV
jgi:hypothetical protein